MAQRPTVTAVAERAGVSVASVSRVLNGLAASPDMQELVNSAAADLGYRPNAMARSLKMRRTHQLAFAVADVGNPVYVEMMRGAEAETRARGYRLLVSSTGGRTSDVLGLLDGLDHGYADGLVLSPVRVDPPLVAALRELRLPTVVIGTVPEDLAVDIVRADSHGGVGLALDHLGAQGRRRVAFVNGPVDTVPGSARSRAFVDHGARLGIDLDPTLRIEAADFTLAAGRVAATELLDRAVPDAVLAGNDLLALAVMQVLGERGLRVPDDVAVVGMDDTELAQVATPALTSVDLGSHERGRLAASLLLERLEDPDRAPQRLVVPPRLRVRGSTGGQG